MKLKRIFSSLLILILLISSSVITSSLPGTTAQAASIKLNKSSLFLSDYSEEGFYGYRLRVLNTKSKVSWKSSNTKVATIDKNGWVVGVSEGSATVTATVGKKKLTCKVYVSLLGLYLKRTSVTVFEGDTLGLSLRGSVKESTWTSSDKNVVTVKKNHNYSSTLTAKGTGTATIKVLVNKKWTLSCKVTVKKKEKIKIDQDYTINGQNVLIKSTNLSPVDTLVSTNVSFYKTKEDYENGKVDYAEGIDQEIQAGQTVVAKITPAILGYDNIEDVYEYYTVTYNLHPYNIIPDLQQSDILRTADIKKKIVGSTKNEIEVSLYSDVIDEVCNVNVAAAYYKDGKMIDIQETYLHIINPVKKGTVKIQTAQYDFYDRLEYDDVEIFITGIGIPNK